MIRMQILDCQISNGTPPPQINKKEPLLRLYLHVKEAIFKVCFFFKNYNTLYMYFITSTCTYFMQTLF